jgi:hypothetical protein
VLSASRDYGFCVATGGFGVVADNVEHGQVAIRVGECRTMSGFGCPRARLVTEFSRASDVAEAPSR